MQRVPIELGHGIHLSPILYEQLHNVVVAVVTGKVNRPPIIQSPTIYLSRVPIFPLLNYFQRLVIHSTFAIVAENLIIFLNMVPKIFPWVLLFDF